MSSHLTHERCSELLAAYLTEDLDSEQHRLVEDHLEHCAQCSAERAGLAALRSSERGDLTGDERALLRAGVLESIRDLESTAASPLQDESDAVVVPLGGREARAGKYLGIAAVLAILAVGSLFVLRGGGLGVTGGDDGDAGSAVGEAEISGEGAGGEDAEDEALQFDARRLRPNVQSDRGTISEGDLDRLGRRAVAFSAASERAPTKDDLTEESAPMPWELLSNARAADKSIDRLAARAGAALASDVDVTECGRTALEELGRRGLATYATTATIEGEDVVIIAFVTGARTPDRYAVFAFPRGDCTTILTSSEGPLD
jgi:hypothetical protein